MNCSDSTFDNGCTVNFCCRRAADIAVGRKCCIVKNNSVAGKICLNSRVTGGRNFTIVGQGTCHDQITVGQVDFTVGTDFKVAEQAVIQHGSNRTVDRIDLRLGFGTAGINIELDRLDDGILQVQDALSQPVGATDIDEFEVISLGIFHGPGAVTVDIDHTADIGVIITVGDLAVVESH